MLMGQQPQTTCGKKKIGSNFIELYEKNPLNHNSKFSLGKKKWVFLFLFSEKIGF